jgi:uncharacterized protein (DUF1697 family)
VPRFAAFLRAVNVGGNNIVPMAGLRHALEASGFKAVKTYLHSGNVTFDAPGTADAAARRIEKQIESWLGLRVAVMARKLDRLVELHGVASTSRNWNTLERIVKSERHP